MGEIVSAGARFGRGVLVHGGAGDVPDARRSAHAEGCLEAARAGHRVIEEGGSALDAVQAAARRLEDLPQFNAGTGACLNEQGEVEHDAAIMEGERLRAGAVCAMPGFKNPIDIARAVLDHGRHVLLAHAGAAEFARARGFAPVDREVVVTREAEAALAKYLSGKGSSAWAGGTIGAVARDRAGHVAAATSTGGMIGKLRGRVGDSPIIGAGTYADDSAGAISATGEGEAVLRYGLALRMSCRLRSGDGAETVAREEMEALRAIVGGHGGVIVVARDGSVAWARSTRTMSFAWASDEGEASGT
jgi:beta-aspartyl-peptidase (threonine type)